MIPVAIIGAGITGLACAQALRQAGVGAVLFDKGRGIGGRVATRRAEGLQFDHGAQFVTARDPGFAAALEDLSRAGMAALWTDGEGQPRLVGIPGMSALARGLAEGLEVQQSAQVTGLRPVHGGWELQIGETRHRAARVVVTVPAPQVLALLGAGHPLLAALAGVALAPCLTLMAATSGAAPFVSRASDTDDLAWIAQDSSKPGRSTDGRVTWVAQASPAFSAQHLERDTAAQCALLLDRFCAAIGCAPGAVSHAAAHRWRYARVTQALGAPFLRAADTTLWLGGDWCLGPRVEAAWQSGTQIARDMLAGMA